MIARFPKGLKSYFRALLAICIYLPVCKPMEDIWA
jgi:hypothetical protein